MAVTAIGAADRLSPPLTAISAWQARWREMRDVMARARVVFGVHGSGWAWSFFTRADDRVHLIEINRLHGRECYVNLHHAIGAPSRAHAAVRTQHGACTRTQAAAGKRRERHAGGTVATQGALLPAGYWVVEPTVEEAATSTTTLTADGARVLTVATSTRARAAPAIEPEEQSLV